MQTLPEDECGGFWLGKRTTTCMTRFILLLDYGTVPVVGTKRRSFPPSTWFFFVSPRDSSIGTYNARNR